MMGVVDVCKICTSQPSKYSCPKCNIKYCSLACYKAEKHSKCTELFYKSCVEDELNVKSLNAEQIKKETLEMLSRFENEGNDDEDVMDDNLLERFAGVDIENASTEDILNRLPPEMKSKFDSFFLSNNPSLPVPEPVDEGCWWEDTVILKGDSYIPKPIIKDLSAPGTPSRTPIVHPKIVPLSSFSKREPNPNLSLSLVDILFSYCFAVRHFNNDIPKNEVPFANLVVLLSLTLNPGSKYSKITFNNIQEVIAQLVLQQEKFQVLFSERPDSLNLALIDLLQILTCTTNVLSALSDLYSIFEASKKQKLISKKIWFYLCFVYQEMYEDRNDNSIVKLKEGLELELRRRTNELNVVKEQEIEVSEYLYRLKKGKDV